jgi:hypothetical protein
MARDFNGSTDRIDYANIWDPNSGPSNVTFAAWLWLDDNTISHKVLTINQSGDTAAGFICDAIGATQTGALNVFRKWSTGSANHWRYGSGNISQGAWVHVLVESDSGGNQDGMENYVDGSLPGSTSNTSGSGSVTGAPGTWSLGGRTFSDVQVLDGRIAEPAVWDRLLAADEIAALAKGFSPLHFRRGLRWHTKLIGRKDIDIIGGTTPTYDGSAVIEHPRIIYPG